MSKDVHAMRKRDFVILLAAILLVVSAPAAAAAEADSLRREAERFAWQKVAAPAVLFSAGVAGATGEWFQTRINEPLRDYAAGIRGDHYLHFDDYIQYVPSATYVGLGFALTPEHGFAERSLAACTAWAMTALLVTPLKYAFGDLLGGAAIGIFSARAAYWLLPAERRLFRMEDEERSFLAMPYCDGRYAGLSLALRF